MSLDKLSVIAHVIVTLVITILYFFSGQEDPTLQSIMMIVIGYWFGSVPINLKK